MKRCKSKSYSVIARYEDFDLIELHPRLQYLAFIEGVGYSLSKEQHAYLESNFNSITKEVITDNKILFIVEWMIVVIAFCLLPCFFTLQEASANNMFLLLAVMIINVFIHECAHLLMQKSFLSGQKAKLGFHFYLPFPSFYVDTTAALFLPHYKRLAVYGAGLAANACFLIVLIILPANIAIYGLTIYPLMIMNIIPLLKNDGYHIMNELVGKNALLKKECSPALDAFIRGILVLLLLLCASLVLAS